MISYKFSRVLLSGCPAQLVAANRHFSFDVISSKSNNDDIPASVGDESTIGISKGIDGWQIMASVCVTRHPVICPPMAPIEHSYSEHLNKLEVEHSILSDFELKVMEDGARKMLGEKELEELGEGDVNQQSALELLDVWKKDNQDFTNLKPVEYEPSPSAVGMSPTRQVVLVQEYKIGSQNMWLLPQGPWKPGETLRQTSERIAAECIDPSLGVRIMGNAPIGFYKYKYPRELRSKGYIGAKVFFYRGYVSMNVRKSLPSLLTERPSEQMWLTQDQIKEKLKKSYFRAISQFLISDD